jgi:DNA-directed RNA polymerase specialized sigma24 family protein
MIKDVTGSPDKFEKLLRWLDMDDRDRAGEKYEDIRHSLIKILAWNGCHEAEDLADRAIDLVAERIDELLDTYEGNPALYFYGVARNLRREYFRRAKLRAPLPEKVASEARPPDVMAEELAHSEFVDECVKRCAAALSPRDQETALAYYQHSKQAKIANRKAMAKKAGVTPSHLRVKIYRIRVSLEKCIRRCLEEGAR